MLEADFVSQEVDRRSWSFVERHFVCLFVLLCTCRTVDFSCCEGDIFIISTSVRGDK